MDPVWPPSAARRARGSTDTWWDSAIDSGVWEDDTGDTGFARLFDSMDNPIMVFGDVQSSGYDLGPPDALFTLIGEPGAMLGFWGILGPGDVSGDGLGDIAYIGRGPQAGYMRVVHPCEDFGSPFEGTDTASNTDTALRVDTAPADSDGGETDGADSASPP